MLGFIDGVNFFELEPQRYWSPPGTWDNERKKNEVKTAIFSNDYLGAKKIDGAFYRFVKDDKGRMGLFGRSRGVGGFYLDKIDWVPQLMPFFEKLPNGTCLLGEAYKPEKEGSNNVTTIMGCLVGKALERQKTEDDKLHYYVFDILAFNGKSLLKTQFEDRARLMEKLSTRVKGNYWSWAKFFRGKELWEELVDVLAQGGEGVVITKANSLYQAGKRTARATWKVKKELEDTIDVVVMGANPPTRLYSGKHILSWTFWINARTGELLEGELYKEYSNGAPIEPVTKAFWNKWAGSLVIGMKKDGVTVPVGALSGLTDEVLENWATYVGKVAEISGMQIMDTKKRGIRHPRFVKWRPDLSENDTDWYRVFGE